MVRASAHALDRIHNRTLMRMGYLKSRVLQKKTVDIGKEKGTNRHHLLFYSEVDEMCFVIVMDVVDKVIITVLPIDYHNTCSWWVSDEAQQQAKDLVLNIKKEKPKKNQNLPTSYRLTGVISGYNQSGKIDKRINLSTIKRKTYGEIDTLQNNENFCKLVRKQASQKMSSNHIKDFEFVGVIITPSTKKSKVNVPVFYDVKDFKY